MAYSVYPQRENGKIIGYMRVFRGSNGKYVYKGTEVDDSEVVVSDAQEVFDFWAAQNQQPESTESLDNRLEDLKKRVEALEAAKAMEVVA